MKTVITAEKQNLKGFYLLLGVLGTLTSCSVILKIFLQ